MKQVFSVEWSSIYKHGFNFLPDVIYKLCLSSHVTLLSDIYGYRLIRLYY